MKSVVVILLFSTLAAGLDSAPKKPPRFDWKFDALAAAWAAGFFADESQTLNCLKTNPWCRETNPLFGPHPSAARLYGLTLAVDGAYLLGSYELRRHGPRPLRRFWFDGMSYPTFYHISAIAGSVRGRR